MTETGSPAKPSTRGPAIIVLVVVAIALAITYCFRSVFGPLLAAVAIAYILEPLVIGLTLRGMSRRLAVGLIFFVFVAIAGTLLLFLGYQGAALVELLEKEKISEGVGAAIEWVKSIVPVGSQPELPDDLSDPDALNSEALSAVVGFVKNIVVGIAEALMSLTSLATIVILTPLYLFYLMLELPSVWMWIKQRLPANDRARSLSVIAELHSGMSAFLRGRIVAALVRGALTAIGLIICGTPFAIVMGLTAGVLSILPFLGSVIAFVAAVALTMAENPSALAGAGVLGVFLIAELLEGFVVIPLVMRKGASLHPLTLLVAVFFWGTALGMFGALLAIPLTLALKILLRAYVLPSVDRLAAAD